MAFVDCKVNGEWILINPGPGVTVLIKKAANDNCSIDLLQLNMVRRNLFFKKSAVIQIVGNVLFFNDSSEVEELAVDEEIAYFHKRAID